MLLCSALYSFTNSGGAPAGNTAAPGDGNCTGCHGGSLITTGANWNNVTISSNVPVNGYSPSTTYTITVTHTQTGINKWGFQAVVLNSANAQIGSVSAGSNNATTVFGGKTYVAHTSSSNTGVNTISWTFNWTSPSTGAGNATVYATVNASDGTGGTAGDQIYAKSLVISEVTLFPTAVISGVPTNNTICLGDTLYLQGSGINSPTSFAWTFSGLTNSALQNPSIVFTAAGSKSISLITTNSFGNSTQTFRSVTVIAKPTATTIPAGPSTINKCGNDSVTLTTSISNAFSFLWSPGNQTTQTIKVKDTGFYSLRVTNPTTGCFATSATLHVVQLPKPIPMLSAVDSICSADSLLLTSSTPFTNYTFVDHQIVLQSGVNNTYKNKFSSGIKNFGLIVTGANNCKSDTIRKTVLVIPKLLAPIMSCGSKTTSSVTFNWLSVNNATGYEVSTNNGLVWSAPNGVLSHQITGLQPNSTIELWVRAIDPGQCAPGNTASLICTNGACERISYSVVMKSSACLKSNIDTVESSISIENLSVHPFGISFNNESYSTTQSYTASIVLGTNNISLKIVDSTNIGCPRVDSTIVITGILPIQEVPELTVKGSLCSADSSVHIFQILQANSGADRFELFKNEDTISFASNLGVISDTVYVSALKLQSGIVTGDKIYALASHDNSGCTLESNTIIAEVFTSPSANFTSVVLPNTTAVFEDITSNSIRRDWLFAGTAIDELNGPSTLTKTFTSGGSKSVTLVTTDSNGCVDAETKTINLFGVGIADIPTIEKMQLYPNPAKDYIELLHASSNAELNIYTMQGKLVLSQILNTPQVDISKLTTGLYFVFLNDEGVIQTGKLNKE